nr:hypothetical protein [Nocardia cyriacigeorgica]
MFDSYGAQRPQLIIDWAAGADTDGAGSPLNASAPPGCRWVSRRFRPRHRTDDHRDHRIPAGHRTPRHLPGRRLAGLTGKPTLFGGGAAAPHRAERSGQQAVATAARR